MYGYVFGSVALEYPQSARSTLDCWATISSIIHQALYLPLASRRYFWPPVRCFDRVLLACASTFRPRYAIQQSIGVFLRIQ
jgi:hypothetical protein